MTQLTSASVEANILTILIIVVIISIILGQLGEKTKKRVISKDYSIFMWATSSSIVLFAWFVLFHISPLVWWKFYFRYAYLGILPFITLAGYMRDSCFAIFKGTEDTITNKISFILFIVTLFYFFGNIFCFVAIGTYIFQKIDDHAIAIRKKQHSPVI